MYTHEIEFSACYLPVSMERHRVCEWLLFLVLFLVWAHHELESITLCKLKGLDWSHNCDTCFANCFLFNRKRGNSGARISHHELFSQILYRTFVVPVQVMTTHYSLSKNLKDLRDDHSLRIDILPAVDDIINSTFSRSLGLRRTDTDFRSDEKLNISGTPTKFLSCKDSNSSLSIQNLATSQNSFPIMPSPFPMVDQYVVSSLACRGGVTGRISQWLLKIISSTTTHTTPTQMPNTIFPQNKSIVMDTHKNNQRAVNSTVFMEYQIAGNRYCQNINRPHKSNNIMFEVNLNSGVARQKCWDIECRGYRSEPILLPLENCPSLLEINETVGDIIIKNALLKDPTCF